MEFDSTTMLYIGLAICSVLAFLVGYSIFFPRLSLHGMAVYEAKAYLEKCHKKLGVKTGFVQPSRDQFNYLGTISSHKYNSVTDAEDYELYQIDIPYSEPVKREVVFIPPPSYETVAEHVPETEVTEVTEVIAHDLPDLEPMTPIPTPTPTPIPVSKGSRTKLESFASKSSYFWE